MARQMAEKQHSPDPDRSDIIISSHFFLETNVAVTHDHNNWKDCKDLANVWLAESCNANM